jgi:hypothetical protein
VPGNTFQRLWREHVSDEVATLQFTVRIKPKDPQFETKKFVLAKLDAAELGAVGRQGYQGLHCNADVTGEVLSYLKQAGSLSIKEKLARKRKAEQLEKEADEAMARAKQLAAAAKAERNKLVKDFGASPTSPVGEDDFFATPRGKAPSKKGDNS